MNAPSDMPTNPVFPSRLPNVGTTIFTVMSALAAEKGAVNLGQGFPDFDCDPRIVDAVAAAMRDGHNQYPPMAGVAPLRDAIADKIAQVYGRRYDPATEITVTAGATQALLTAILCAVHPGDEVIVVEPTYDSYLPSIELAGGKPVKIMLERDEELEVAGARPSAFARVKVAATKDGKLVGWESSSWGTGGPGGGGSPPIPYVFNIPNQRKQHTAVMTNIGPARAWRAPNHPQACVLTL